MILSVNGVYFLEINEFKVHSTVTLLKFDVVLGS
jgi:hypothetical protein